MYSPPCLCHSETSQHSGKTVKDYFPSHLASLSCKHRLFFTGVKLVQAMLASAWSLENAMSTNTTRHSTELLALLYFPFHARPFSPLFKTVLSKGNVMKSVSTLQKQKCYASRPDLCDYFFFKVRLVATFIKQEVALILKRITKRKVKLLGIMLMIEPVSPKHHILSKTLHIDRYQILSKINYVYIP